MAYSDDAVKAKLSALNETQDSIVTVAQWIMFHRRHADKTAQLWSNRLSESNTSKRLNLIYLANEVVQQSRARQKTDFLYAFEPLIGEATALAYKNASQEVQGKLKRVVEVWKQRSIFNPAIQLQIEQRLDELDQQRGGTTNGGSRTGGKLGGSLFGGGSGGSAPEELSGVAKSQAAVTKAEVGLKPALDKANSEYAKMTDPETPTPTAPLHAARLSALVKNLASAQGAVETSIKTRIELLTGLEKLIESNRGRLAEDEATLADLDGRKDAMETKRRDVEDMIMRGLSTPTSPETTTPDTLGTPQLNGTGRSHNQSKELERPEAEGFTPPPPDVESFTPPLQDQDMDPEAESLTAIIGEDDVAHTSTTGADLMQEYPPNLDELMPAFEPPPAITSNPAAVAANDFLDSLNISQATVRRQASTEIPSGATSDPRLKRRKMSHKQEPDDDIFGQGAIGGVDEDGVSAALMSGT